MIAGRAALLEARIAHQEAIDGASRLAALPLRPDDEALSPTAVAGGENPRLGGPKIRQRRFDIAARIELHAHLFEHTRPIGAQETQREEHEVSLHLELAAGDLRHG